MYSKEATLELHEIWINFRTELALNYSQSDPQRLVSASLATLPDDAFARIQKERYRI